MYKRQVYGFFRLLVIVPLIRSVFRVSGASILAAMLVLGIMILPTVIGLTAVSYTHLQADEYRFDRTGPRQIKLPFIYLFCGRERLVRVLRRLQHIAN